MNQNICYNLKEIIDADSQNFRTLKGGRSLTVRLRSNPISDQYYIWQYIKTLRKVEFYGLGGVFLK